MRPSVRLFHGADSPARVGAHPAAPNDDLPPHRRRDSRLEGIEHGPDVHFVAFAVLCVFGSPVLITWRIVNAKRKSLAGASDELAALRADMQQMRQQIVEQMASQAEANAAEITLLLEDMRRDALPPSDTDE